MLKVIGKDRVGGCLEEAVIELTDRPVWGKRKGKNSSIAASLGL